MNYYNYFGNFYGQRNGPTSQQMFQQMCKEGKFIYDSTIKRQMDYNEYRIQIMLHQECILKNQINHWEYLIQKDFEQQREIIRHKELVLSLSAPNSPPSSPSSPPSDLNNRAPPYTPNFLL